MVTPLLSVCIPTYNRAPLLDQCLASLTVQFKNMPLQSEIEIVVHNNASNDKTEKILKKYIKKFKNIHYYKNEIKVGADINMCMAANHAKGKYIWFFSDDDLQKRNAISSVIKIIQKNLPDVLMVNMDLYSKDLSKILDTNLFRNKKDVFVKTKKDFFSYLEKKFFLPFDWHIGVYSSLIVSKKLFQKNWQKVLFYNGFLNQFAHSSLFYYFPDDFKIYIIADSLVKFRADNRSFGPSDRVQFLIYWYPILNRHYGIIKKINRKSITTKFIFLLTIKNLTRTMRVLILSFFKVDIADVLMKFFYRSSKGEKKKWSISV